MPSDIHVTIDDSGLTFRDRYQTRSRRFPDLESVTARISQAALLPPPGLWGRLLIRLGARRSPPETPFDALVHECTDALAELQRGRMFPMRPAVRVRFGGRVIAALGAYPEEIVTLALLAAGARIVLFEENANWRPARSRELRQYLRRLRASPLAT